jgi:small subunit ribosomal protein S16
MWGVVYAAQFQQKRLKSMAVSIRLARQGAKKRPFYRIVATERTSPRDGRFIEQLGYHDPRAKVTKIDHARLEHWLAVGAKPTDSVRGLVKKAKQAEAKAA